MFSGGQLGLLWALAAILLFCVTTEGAVGKVDKAIFVGQPVRFENKTEVPEGASWEWEWNFGDGSAPSNEREPTHYYKDSGSHDVTLTVLIKVGDEVLRRQAPTPLKIEVKKINPQIRPLPETIYVGQKVEIEDKTKGPKNMRRKWNFGSPDKWGFWDGSDNSGNVDQSNPVIFFKEAGPHKVNLELSVVDENNQLLPGIDVSDPEQSISVSKITPDFMIREEKEDKVFKVGEKLELINATKGPPNIRYEWEVKADGKILKPEGRWDFGDKDDDANTVSPTITFKQRSDYEVILKVIPVDSENNLLQGVTVPPKSTKIEVRPTYEQPEIIAIRLEEEDAVVTAEGNYTVHVMVEVNGTYLEAKLQTEGFDLKTQTFKQAISPGLHKFALVLPKPEDSVSQAPVTQDLKITATVDPDPDGPAHVSRALTKTIPVKLRPEQPWWLLYAYILAGTIVLGAIILLVILARRPVVPGTVTVLMGDEIYLSSPSVGGPKKGNMTLQLGKLSGASTEYDDYWLVITAARRDRANRLRISAILKTKLEIDGDLTVNGDYHDFGRTISCTGVMRFEWSDESGKRMEVTYDTHQSDDDFGYEEDSDDDDYENY